MTRQILESMHLQSIGCTLLLAGDPPTFSKAPFTSNCSVINEELSFHSPSTLAGVSRPSETTQLEAKGGMYYPTLKIVSRRGHDRDTPNPQGTEGPDEREKDSFFFRHHVSENEHANK